MKTVDEVPAPAAAEAQNTTATATAATAGCVNTEHYSEMIWTQISHHDQTDTHNTDNTHQHLLSQTVEAVTSQD